MIANVHYHTICNVCQSGEDLDMHVIADDINGERVITVETSCGGTHDHETMEIAIVPCRDLSHANHSQHIVSERELQHVTVSHVIYPCS